ncbi:SDR family oxidoreductase [bacterium]|nr:MAG: SDR family oxidoreductase [bacterium]
MFKAAKFCLRLLRIIPMSVTVTPGVTPYVEPAKWKEHRFGLPPERWAELKGRSFLITGAGTGYGMAMSSALAAAGGTVFLCGRRKLQLQKSIESMRQLDIPTNNCHAVVCDVTDINGIKNLRDEIQRITPSLYGLVNSAALPPRGSLQTETLDYWDSLMRTNVTAPWLLTKELFPQMAAGRAVRVLFITSEAGWAFTHGVGPYNVSKAALNNLSASMAGEYATGYPGVDIQMNALDPSEARTEMNQGSPYSPFAVVSMALVLLSHPAGGPNGRFFHRDGRHLQFTYSAPYDKLLL